ncbi:MAG TPA: hypothetical protein VL651_03135 [Bacteroidia bacterium]|nr:hypothetical protein [Bacteroidia bacterium]
MKGSQLKRNSTAILLLMIPFFAFGKNDGHMTGLQLSFRVFDRGLLLKNYSLSIYCNGELTDSINVRKSNLFCLNMEFNNNYVIRINRPGYRERLILIDTKVPDRKKNKAFEYSFDISMLADSLGANTLADLPTMLIQYDGHEKDFNYSQTYSQSVGHLPEFTKERRIHLHRERIRPRTA